MAELSTERRISADEALALGYVWVRMGYNHRLNTPLFARIKIMKPLMNCGITLGELEEAKQWVADWIKDPEPAGDIPLERSR